MSKDKPSSKEIARRWLLPQYSSLHDIQTLTKEINDLISIRCKEQREICANEFKKNIGRQSETDAQTNIRYAPSPTD